MKILWHSLGEHVCDQIMRNSTKWLGDNERVFSDEFIDWVETHCPSLRCVEEYSRPVKIFEVRNITERMWKYMIGEKLYLQIDDDEAMLFKLTWS